MKYVRFIKSFITYLGTQNCYYGVDKVHWWRTRVGFKTAWEIAKVIHL